jgi:hypothetical protein
MSDYEFHIGKLKKIQLKENQSYEDFAKETLNSLGKQELPTYCKGWIEFLLENCYDTYLQVNNELFCIIESEENRDAGDSYCILTENQDGTISFSTRFYNGGTCLTEMIQYELENKLKKINYGK